jgi:hypothetical protein
MPGPASTLRRLSCVAALLAALQGCGTTGQPVQQSIWIETPDCASASCELRNDRGQWTLERTPGSVTVTTSPAPLEVVCRAGELRTSASAPSTVPPASGSGLAAGAAIGGGAMGAAMVGMGPAGVVLIVAATLTGAGVGHAVEAESKTFAYPERIVVPLRCPVADDGRPRLGLTVRGLTEDEARRARVPAGAALVVAIVDGSRASAAGLRAGDLVLGANGAPVDSAARLEALVHALAPESTLTLQVRRDGALAEVRLLPAVVQ